MSWVDDFLLMTSNIPSPELFRKWAAISIVAAALERKVYIRSYGSHLYPNLYVVLTGPPGVGKTEVTWRARDMIASLPNHNLARNSLSKASLIDNLVEGVRSITQPDQVPAVTTFNALYVCQNELGVLLPAYDMEFMNTLTDLYDGKSYTEMKRTAKLTIEMPRVNVNMLAACTPGYLSSTLPEGAWDQGFTSRVMFIYSGEVVLQSLWAETDDQRELEDVLKTDLKRIGELVGGFRRTEEYSDFLDKWHLARGEPQPDHPRLYHYNTRRTARLLKLSMIASAAESSDLVLDLRHAQTAMDWMIEAEAYMPDIFKAMANTSYGQIMDEIWHFVYKIHVKEKRGTPEQRLIGFISQRTPAHNVDRMLEVMCKAGLLKKEIGEKSIVYMPGARKE